MAFVVDSAEWCFDSWTDGEVVGAIDNLLDRVDTAHSRDETVWIGFDLQSKPVRGNLDLWSFLPTVDLNISNEVQQELAAWLSRATCYENEDEWPDGMDCLEIQIDSGPSTANPDLAWAHHQVRAGHATACLALRRSGAFVTVSREGSATVYWIRSEMDHRTFWRNAIDVERDNETTLERLAPHAYPDLYFHNDVWRGLNRLAGAYTAVKLQVKSYLSVLDEWGIWAFTFPPPALSPNEAMGPDHNARPSNQVIERRFRGLGLDMAPENPDVYANGRCRRAREIKLGAQTFYCEWHGKLERHQNRLYIYPPVFESNGKVVVAIFHEHLPLPNDS